METHEEKKESVKVISIADFTAYAMRSKKIYEDKDEDYIFYDLCKMCDTHILHSITEYVVESTTVKEFIKPFIMSDENSKKHLNEGE